MLRFLRIRRLAVIDAVEVEFGPGLNVLTGETGAGKSILVEAVGLLLGGRASGDLVRTGEDLATVEAIFESGGEELLVRREITAQGRSRAFVNGDLTTAGTLRELSSRLIELHGQHEHHTLLDPGTHLATLDTYGGHENQLAAVGTACARLRACEAALADARRAARERGNRHDLLTFQTGELTRAQLRPGEDEELATTRHVLASAERIERLCQESYEALYERDDAVLGALGGVWRKLGDLAAIDATFQPYLDAKSAIKSQLEDLAIFLRRYADSIEASPARLQQVEDRLALLDRLKKKYGPTLADAIARRDDLLREIEDLDESESRVAALERDHAQAREGFLALAEALSADRRARAGEFSRALESVLAELAMGETRFDVRFGERLSEGQWTPTGIDVAEFFVSPNPGEDLRPLARIVSGGELSRIMLAIKTLTATSRSGYSTTPDRVASVAAPGLIFDEVDAGIGGRIADVVGRKLRVLGSTFQVLCITHLAQIAAYADSHFQIEKSVAGGRTGTTVVRLEDPGRVEELSRMLAGAGVSDAIRSSAREMLNDRRGGAGAKGEVKPKGESEASRTKAAAAAPARPQRGAR